MNLLLLSITLALFSFNGITAQDCNVDNNDKVDCGHFGTQQPDCESSGCCWVPVYAKADIPWCFHPSGYQDPCDSANVNWDASDPGFTQDFYDTMFDLYKANLNVEGSGAVVAAPDQETPGGSYYYHWMRDAGLSIKAWLDLNDNDYNKVSEILDAYVKWVNVVQNKVDPNGIDVRVEPKFTIPDGEPYTGGWCRPQTDGPALRAMALSKYGMIQVKAGKRDRAASDVWPLVAKDMEWVTSNWDQNGCDLWEEVQSSDFFWNRMGYVYSLNVAADFADQVGQDGANYRSVAESVKATLSGHYTGSYLFESTNREQDGSVIHAIATFGEYLYGPTSEEAANTIKTYVKTFCREYPINQEDITNGEPGILIGRYPGDSYGGGNPWQLLTAVLAEVFYLGASATQASIETRGIDYQLTEDNKAWMSLLQLPEGSLASDLALKQMSAGDAVMQSLYKRVKNDGGRIDEQIDKNNGAQTSAEGLTWSYANILHALKVRGGVVAAIDNYHASK